MPSPSRCAGPSLSHGSAAGEGKRRAPAPSPARDTRKWERVGVRALDIKLGASYGNSIAAREALPGFAGGAGAGKHGSWH